MNSDKMAKLIFIDGPLEGQTKFVHRDEIIGSRTYRAYVPRSTYDMQKNFDLKENEVRVVCTQVDYIPFTVPSSYGTERFIMCQQNAGLGN